MELYKVIYDILNAPFNATGNNIEGFKYSKACSKCGFSDEEQIEDLKINFNKAPSTNFFSIYRQEPSINLKVKENIKQYGLTGLQIRPIIPNPVSETASVCKEGMYYQLIFEGKKVQADHRTKLKKNPDWCNKCKRNNNFVTIDNEDPIYFNGNEIEEQDFLLCENEAFPLVSTRFKEMVEKEGLTGIEKFIKCYDISNEKQIEERDLRMRDILNVQFNFDIIDEILAVKLNSEYIKGISKILKSKKLLKFCEDTPLILNGKQLVDINKQVRRNGFNGMVWPKNFLVIGDPFTGDFFFMNMTENDPKVYYADNEKDFNSEVILDLVYAQNLDQFVKLKTEE